MHYCYSLDFLNLWTFFLIPSSFAFFILILIFSYSCSVSVILFHASLTPMFLQWLMISSLNIAYQWCLWPLQSRQSWSWFVFQCHPPAWVAKANFLLMFTWKAFQISGSFRCSILNLTLMLFFDVFFNLSQKFVITRLWLLFMLKPGNALVFALLMPDSELECRFHFVHAESNIGIPYGFYSWQILADVWLSLVTSLQDGPKGSLQSFHDSWPTLVFQSLWKFMFFLFGC